MNKWNGSKCRSLPRGKVTVKTYLQHWLEAKHITGRDELLWLWGSGSTDLSAVSQASWGELQLWALVSSEKLIKSETAAGGKMGGGGTEGQKEHEREREGKRREPLGMGLLKDQLLLLSSLSNFPSFTPPLLFFPSQICLSPPLLPPSLSFVIFLPPSSSFLALRVRTGC